MNFILHEANAIVLQQTYYTLTIRLLLLDWHGIGEKGCQYTNCICRGCTQPCTWPFPSVTVARAPRSSQLPSPESAQAASPAMPQKRISLAAGLKAQGPMRKVGRAGGSNGPLVACARRWGGAHWVFEGVLGRAILMPQVDARQKGAIAKALLL